MKLSLGVLAAACAVVTVGLVTTFQRPSVAVVQRGYQGTGMQQILYRPGEDAKTVQNQAPPVEPPADLAGVPSKEVYSNVQVLGDVDAAEFTRLMTSMTNWVAPKQGCAYCHNLNNLASDELYTKIVARRMLQMTRHINQDWTTHVGATGVTCYTCHRGQPVPAYVWFKNPGPAQSLGALGDRAGQNAPTLSPGMASLPYDPYTPFLEDQKEIRVVSTTALPGTDHTSIKQTEWTYALMMSFSQSLGVNCTFCHNTRSFAAWDQSTPQRATAWYGIRMVRDLNEHVLDPLRSVLPGGRWGPLGDGPKVNCATCHQGVYKPLYGASILKDYPELATVAAETPAAPDAMTPPPPDAPAPPAAPKTTP